ncbi:ATP synthase subunit [Grosmannia clavigera kw1407]|uniref:ATP synthase subunit n=1 Tax=Grosmannia clavigera (strain kw1407 / UAMH 11150) TaxID=655863 RepID=F0XT77_GROCL|nr:ATP synthase subunit [Grosmannia clavigera kw1407]EFW99115.1 ATP synthase subunit [Grosmannia clavigera kw1407]
MSQVHALSDDQVGQELRKMTAFIQQEATEKAREIEIKANEEFAIEKSKLVRQETDAIDATYAKKFKQAALSQQITRSTVTNKTRLRVLGARQQLLDDLFETARARLAADATADAARYRAVLVQLVLEGAYAMQEPALQVRAREADADAVRGVFADVTAEFEKQTGSALTLTIDEANPLPAGSAGGVSVVGGNGKIEIDNTLETRLKLLEHDALPAMREALFGKNENRKFFD